MIRYDYDRMHEKASELRAILPQLLSEGKWQDIAEVAKVSPDIWSGKAADAYHQLIKKAVGDRIDKLVLEFPSAIDKSADNMQQKEKQQIEAVNKRFGIFMT